MKGRRQATEKRMGEGGEEVEDGMDEEGGRDTAAEAGPLDSGEEVTAPGEEGVEGEEEYGEESFEEAGEQSVEEEGGVGEAEQAAAAVKIQARARGMKERRQATERKMAKDEGAERGEKDEEDGKKERGKEEGGKGEDDAGMEAAAVKIQARARGMKGRREAASKNAEDDAR